jgi:hypothetical protein
MLAPSLQRLGLDAMIRDNVASRTITLRLVILLAIPSLSCGPAVLPQLDGSWPSSVMRYALVGRLKKSSEPQWNRQLGL